MPRKKVDDSVEVVYHCADCANMYFPSKDYPNYSLYLDYDHKLFLCKCKVSKYAHFLKEKQCKDFKLRNNG